MVCAGGSPLLWVEKGLKHQRGGSTVSGMERVGAQREGKCVLAFEEFVSIVENPGLADGVGNDGFWCEFEGRNKFQFFCMDMVLQLGKAVTFKISVFSRKNM